MWPCDKLMVNEVLLGLGPDLKDAGRAQWPNPTPPPIPFSMSLFEGASEFEISGGQFSHIAGNVYLGSSENARQGESPLYCPGANIHCRIFLTSSSAEAG